MISVSGRKWQEVKVDKKVVEKIHQDYEFSKILSQLIVSRNFDKNEIYSIENNLEIKNIFQNNPDFVNSVKLVEKTIKNKENICILGDYDVDGSAATSLIVNFLQNLKHPYFYYIPDRVNDGYGPSKKLFEKLILRKPKLIIMVDCGSTSVEAINFLNKKNISSLIIDHHEINRPFPKANMIINPKKNNGYLEYDYLCATALTYFFLDILVKKLNNKIQLRKYLIYVLLATVCDVMPLRKLNRLISLISLKEFKVNENKAIKELYKVVEKKNKININDLGYLIGPILNAGGRLGKSSYATELLSTDNCETIKKKSIELVNLNNQRKKIELKILKDINFQKLDNKERDIIIYYNPSINEGLLGIIASRFKDFFNKPSIVITNSNNILKGSARSIQDYDMGKAIKKSLDKDFILSGGGHSMAAGFSLKKENLSRFTKFIVKDFSKKKISRKNLFLYDSEISASAINKDFYNDINKIRPFGNGNPLPIFLVKELKTSKLSVLNERHISCLLKTKTGFSIKSIAFDSINSDIGKYLLNYKKNISVIGQITENFWNNKKSLQLIIKDLIL